MATGVAFVIMSPTGACGQTDLQNVMPTVRQIFRDNPMPPRQARETGRSSGGSESRGGRTSSSTGTLQASSPDDLTLPEKNLEWKAYNLNLQGVGAFERGDYLLAIALFEQAHSSNPNEATISENLANAIRAKHNAERKVREERALESVRTDTRKLAEDISTADREKSLSDIEFGDRRAEVGSDAFSGVEFSSSVKLRGGNDILRGLEFNSVAKSSASPMASLKGNTLIMHPENLHPPTPIGRPLTPANATRDLRSLRSDLEGLQEALRRLDRSGRMEAEERERWADEVEQVSTDAIYRGIELGSGLLNKYALELFRSRLATDNAELQRAVTMLAGTYNPNRREQLHAVARALGERKMGLQRAIRLVTNIDQAKRAIKVFELARSNDDDLTRTLKGLKQLTDLALAEPSIQATLKFSGAYGQTLKYGSSIVDSAYAVVAESFAMARIAQLNENTRVRLLNVANLSFRLEQTMRKIKDLEAELPAR